MSTNLKSRWTAAVIAFFMLLTVFVVLPQTGTADVFGATKKGTVKKSRLIVRAHAGKTYKKLGTLKKGKTITIRGTKKAKSGKKWYKTRLNSRKGNV